jgi:hypothetical protein
MNLYSNNLIQICYNCRKSVGYFKSYANIECSTCRNLLSVTFRETKIPNKHDLLAWKDFYLNYEKSNEKEAASLFAELYKVSESAKETQSEEKLKIALNKLQQAARKKRTFKYLKDWRYNSEIKSIFISYLQRQPRLCILLIEAGYVITEDLLLLALKTNVFEKNHIDYYFEVLSIMLRELNLVSNDIMKKDNLFLTGGEKPKRIKLLSQHITIMPNFIIIDHKKDTYLHNFIREMSNWLNLYSNFLNNPISRYEYGYDYKLRELNSKAEGFITTCKFINDFIFLHVGSCTISKMATMKNVKNESIITLGKIFIQNLKDSIKSIEKFMKLEEFREFKSLLPKIVDLQNLVIKLLELFEKSIKQQRKASNRKIKRKLELKPINLEESVEDLKGCF